MESCRPTFVQVEIALRLVAPEGTAVPVRASLKYDPQDPYAIHVIFHAGIDDPGGDVSWSFARELLVEGMRQPTGMGDVRIWPWTGGNRPAVALALSSPDGYALFEAPGQVVQAFLERTYTQVPVGAESDHLDIESSLSHLLGSRDGDPR